MYVQISYEVVSQLHSKLCGMSREKWDTFDNKKRMKMETLKSKLGIFIRVCRTVMCNKSTFPVLTDDMELILEILK